MNNKLVLIADDEVHIREVISYTLGNAGLEVIMAQDGEEALELAKSEHPDLLITDYQMPGLDGMELCLQLRQDPRTQQIPAIILTARGPDIAQDKLDKAGIEMIVAKPFSPREVLSCAKELLEGENTEVSAGKVRK